MDLKRHCRELENFLGSHAFKRELATFPCHIHEWFEGDVSKIVPGENVNLDYTCYECDKPITGPCYVCTECCIVLHQPCANSRKEVSNNDFILNGMLLYFLQNLPEGPPSSFTFDSSSCACCNLPLWGLTYKSIQGGGSYAHKFCLEAPPVIEDHPLHPYCTLRAGFVSNLDRICDVCRNASTGIFYKCSRCDFDIHLGCIHLTRSINLKRVHYCPLTFVGYDSYMSNLDRVCNVCSEPIQRPPLLGCSRCSVYFHPLCVLPWKVESKHHQHDLVLVKSCVEDSAKEYYCNACGQHRDPSQPVYQCKECDYVLEIDCAISKEFHVLDDGLTWVEKHGLDLFHSGDHSKIHGITAQQSTFSLQGTETELRGSTTEESPINENTSTDSDEEHLSCDDFFMLLTEDDTAEIQSVYARTIMETYDADNDYTELILSLGFGKTYDWLLDDLDLENFSEMYAQNMLAVIEPGFVVGCGGNMIPKKLAPVLESLFAKYGDITEESFVSPRPEVILLTTLCHAVHNMCNTYVGEVNTHSLNLWFYSILRAYCGGLRADFAFDCLVTVLHAHFARLLAMAPELRIEISSMLAFIESKELACSELKKEIEQLKLEEEVEQLDLTKKPPGSYRKSNVVLGKECSLCKLETEIERYRKVLKDLENKLPKSLSMVNENLDNTPKLEGQTAGISLLPEYLSLERHIAGFTFRRIYTPYEIFMQDGCTIMSIN